jgi:uncharacterized protein (TIGR02996 family)
VGDGTADWRKRVEHCATELLEVLADNPDVSVRRVIEWEEGGTWYDWRHWLVYADWLQEQGCEGRATQVLRDVAECRRIYEATKQEAMNPAYASVSGRELWDMEKAGVPARLAAAGLAAT